MITCLTQTAFSHFVISRYTSISMSDRINIDPAR